MDGKMKTTIRNPVPTQFSIIILIRLGKWQTLRFQLRL